MSKSKDNSVAIVGGGPAGLFCAYLLLEKGYRIDLYDQSTGLAKKFLVAGKGGLNLTHSENLDLFAQKYTHNEKLFESLLRDFSPTDLRSFCSELGVETFVGSSGRVFPTQLKAAQMLLNWQERLHAYPSFNLHKKHCLIGIDETKTLTFESIEGIKNLSYQNIVLALGGGSWRKTGSDGKWMDFLSQLKIKRAPLQPMNCGFETKWSSIFLEKLEQGHLKNIAIKFKQTQVRGEAILTSYGIEGGGIYALSNFIRDEIDSKGSAAITLDLKPDLTQEEIDSRFEKKKHKESLTNFLKKNLKLDETSLNLLYEKKGENLQERIKNCKLTLHAPRPIDEAISTSGGILFSELTDYFESKKIPGLFFVGEMLDFEAPTGGYLLQGCFSTAYRACLAFDAVP